MGIRVRVRGGFALTLTLTQAKKTRHIYYIMLCSVYSPLEFTTVQLQLQVANFPARAVGDVPCPWGVYT